MWAVQKKINVKRKELELARATVEGFQNKITTEELHLQAAIIVSSLAEFTVGIEERCRQDIHGR